MSRGIKRGPFGDVPAMGGLIGQAPCTTPHCEKHVQVKINGKGWPQTYCPQMDGCGASHAAQGKASALAVIWSISGWVDGCELPAKQIAAEIDLEAEKKSAVKFVPPMKAKKAKSKKSKAAPEPEENPQPEQILNGDDYG